MLFAVAVGVPQIVEPAGWVTMNSRSGKSARTSATFHFLTVGWMLGSE